MSSAQRGPAAARDEPLHPLIEALVPVAEGLGSGLYDADGHLVAGREIVAGRDVPLLWQDRQVGVLRLPPLHDALPLLLTEIQRDFGKSLADLSRLEKQEAVARLERRGAFVLRKSVEDVADALGVSRFTVYNYLARSQDHKQ